MMNVVTQEFKQIKISRSGGLPREKRKGKGAGEREGQGKGRENGLGMNIKLVEVPVAYSGHPRESTDFPRFTILNESFMFTDPLKKRRRKNPTHPDPAFLTVFVKKNRFFLGRILHNFVAG